MEIVKKNVAELKFAPYNPRYISDTEMEKLKKSIKEFGLVEPLVWNKRTGYVVGGNQRLQALMELGVKEVDVIVIDLDDDEEKALNVALNKISGEWDYEKLEELFHKLDTDLYSLTGFDDVEIEDLIKEINLDEFYETSGNDENTEKKKKEKIYICPHCGTKFNEEGEIIE